MPRKEITTKADLLQNAFELVRAEGIEEVTARKLATKTGCSTQPIFRVYKSMDELIDDLIEEVIGHFERFYASSGHQETLPFINLGMAYIDYAANEKNLFQLLFMSTKRNGRSLYDLLNGSNGNVINEIRSAAEQGVKNPEELFMKMWIFIHGAAAMTITGDYDLDKEETTKFLVDAYKSFA